MLDTGVGSDTKAVWCCVVSCGVVSCRLVSSRVVSCRVVSCRVVSCRVVSSWELAAVVPAARMRISAREGLLRDPHLMEGFFPRIGRFPSFAALAADCSSAAAAGLQLQRRTAARMRISAREGLLRDPHLMEGFFPRIGRFPSFAAPPAAAFAAPAAAACSYSRTLLQPAVACCRGMRTPEPSPSAPTPPPRVSSLRGTPASPRGSHHGCRGHRWHARSGPPHPASTR